MRHLTIALSCVTMAAIAVTAQQNPPALPGTVQAPPQPYVLGEKGSGTISGVVTDGVTGEPIEGALVSLGAGGRGGATPPPRQLTDALGRFAFTDLPAYTEYTLNTFRPGFLPGAYRRIEQSPIAARLVLKEGQWINDVNIRMWQPTGISGFVRDEAGEPVVGVPVRVLNRVTVGGTQWWAAGPSASTDDRGWYRITGLTSGFYVVHVPNIQITLSDGAAAPAVSTPLLRAPEASLATAGGQGRRVIVGHYAMTVNRAHAYPMAFHPAARTLDAATPVELTYGRDLTGVDVALAPVPTARVSGRVNGPTELVSRMPIRLLPFGSEQLGAGAEAAITAADADGRFVFEQVPAGDYTLVASRIQTEYSVQTFGSRSGLLPPSQSATPIFNAAQIVTSGTTYFTSRGTDGMNAAGRATVSVGATEVSDVIVELQRGVTVSGRYVFDDLAAAPENSPPPTQVMLEPADGDIKLGVHRSVPPARGTIPTTFSIPDVLPGNYIVAGSTLGSPWHMVLAEWNGRNLLGTPITVGDEDVTNVVIHLSRKRTWIEGAVTDGGGPATGGGIITFAATPSMWTNYGQTAPLIRTSTVVNDGTYRVQQIPPGEYFMIAVSDVDRYRWQEPGFLQAASALATRVKVVLGATTQVNLRLMQVPR